jgi:protein TonB
MASLGTTEFIKATPRTAKLPFALIEEKGLLARLGQEIKRAAYELAEDPRGFLRGLFPSDVKDEKRRRRIVAGLTLAVVTHAALLGVIVYAGWHRFLDRPASETNYKIIELKPGDFKPTPEAAASKPNNLPDGDGAGGGGGGQNSSHKPSGGVLPQMSPQPQIVKLNAPSVPLPSLPVPPTIVGQATMPPPADAAIGVPDAKLGEPPSPGSGSGGGLGTGNGTGVGAGTGPGTRRGSGGNRGGGGVGSHEGGGDDASGPIDWTRLKNIPGSTDIVFIRRPTPVVTPEAEANKVSGVVLLRATFHADGRITDIEVISPVPYMTESAIESLARSTFRPATRNGVPVTVRKVLVRVRVSTQLR